MAFRTDGQEYWNRITMDDKQSTAISRTARLCRFHSAMAKEFNDIAKHLDVDVRELLVGLK